MKNRDLVSGLFLFGIGGFFCWGAQRMGLYSSGLPVAGLFPFFVGATLVVLAAIILILAIQKGLRGEIEQRAFFPERDSFRKVLFSVLSLVAYQLSLPYLGFILTTVLFLFFLLGFIESQRWTTIVLTAFLVTASSYSLFHLFLKIPLPKGILGI